MQIRSKKIEEGTYSERLLLEASAAAPQSAIPSERVDPATALALPRSVPVNQALKRLLDEKNQAEYRGINPAIKDLGDKIAQIRAYLGLPPLEAAAATGAVATQ